MDERTNGFSFLNTRSVINEGKLGKSLDNMPSLSDLPQYMAHVINHASAQRYGAILLNVRHVGLLFYFLLSMNIIRSFLNVYIGKSFPRTKFLKEV